MIMEILPDIRLKYRLVATSTVMRIVRLMFFELFETKKHRKEQVNGNRRKKGDTEVEKLRMTYALE